jgi:hypothetical protein
MKKLRYILLGLGALTLTSCSDFLSILPMSDVVLENYWTEKKDVQSVINNCYASLEQSDCLTRMAVWGELRSDNIYYQSSTPAELRSILQENMLETNSYCKWDALYRTINYCNTVIHYAPQVEAKDPNYTEDETRANIAEATAIRALCYFYLIRTFRDVPYVTEPSVNDNTVYQIPATKFDDILQQLINSLETVKNDAVKRYYTDDNNMAYYNSSKITRYTIYTLLADMYLWKGDYAKCSEYCDLVLDYKKQQYEEKKSRGESVADLFLFKNKYPLLLEGDGTTTSGSSYNRIFGSQDDGHSFESIFELDFAHNNNVYNGFIPDFYETSNASGNLSVPDFLTVDIVDGKNILFSKTDCRYLENIDAAKSAITKYCPSVTIDNKKMTATKSLNEKDNNTCGWILYRMTDVMLMKAEAEIMQGASHYDTAFELIDAVYRRANNQTTDNATGALSIGNYNKGQATMEDLLFQERQRELMYEGKRWFDLVRMVRRDGNTQRAATLITRKFKDNVNTVKIKLADPNIFYYPYAESELKVNPYLIQNTAYNKGDDNELTNK